jgi:hypothetical protein
MKVLTIDGEVVVLGPDGVAVSLTPDAAEESARRLAGCAHDARRWRPPPSQDEPASP